MPTDESDGTERAVEHTIDHGTTYDTALHVLYVVESALFTDPSPKRRCTTDSRRSNPEAIDTVIARADDAGVSTTEGFVSNRPSHLMILSYADEHDIGPRAIRS